MDTKPDISDNTNKLAELATICNQELERNKKYILESQQLIDQLKMAKLETKYFVECSFDYLFTANTKITSPQPKHSSEGHSDPIIIDFESARTRLKRTTNQINGKLKRYR